MITYENLNRAYRRRRKKKLHRFTYRSWGWEYHLDKDEFTSVGNFITVRRSGDYLVKGDRIVDQIAYTSITRMVAIVTEVYLRRKFGRRYNALWTGKQWITGDFRIDKNRHIFNKRPYTKNVTDKVQQRKINKFLGRLKFTAPFVNTENIRANTWDAKLHLEKLETTPTALRLYKIYGPQFIKNTLKKTRKVRWIP